MCHAYRKHIPLQIIVGVRTSWSVKQFSPKNKWAPASSMATVMGATACQSRNFPRESIIKRWEVTSWQQQNSLPCLLPSTVVRVFSLANNLLTRYMVQWISVFIHIYAMCVSVSAQVNSSLCVGLYVLKMASSLRSISYSACIIS